MYPDIDNKIIENEIQLFIEKQDIVKEIDKLDDNYSIVSTISNRLSQSMRLILNKKMNQNINLIVKNVAIKQLLSHGNVPHAKAGNHLYQSIF